MKNIKYYLHLYLGCQFVLKIRDTENLTAQMTFGVEALCATFSGKTDELIKPILILRPLSNVRPFEEVEATKRQDEIKGNSAIEVFAAKINYYRSIHVDCDGLIECGLAIDATTIKTINHKP